VSRSSRSDEPSETDPAPAAADPPAHGDARTSVPSAPAAAPIPPDRSSDARDSRTSLTGVSDNGPSSVAGIGDMGGASSPGTREPPVRALGASPAAPTSRRSSPEREAPRSADSGAGARPRDQHAAARDEHQRLISAPAPPSGLTGWKRVRRWLRPPRKLKFTREGKYYLGITLGVGFAAINTGNNLLYLLLGMLLSLIVVSGVMSDLSLRQLTVQRRLPTRAQVGRAHLVEIEVYNHKKRVPSYAIEVEDLRAGQPADKRCFFLKISPASAQVAAYRRTPTRRGRDRHTGFRIATRFPFGLFEKSREVDAEGDLVIYPAVDPVRLAAEDRGRQIGGIAASGRGSSDETYALRFMREGDDRRDIYWRKSTMGDQLVMRERARETRPDVELVIDAIRPRGKDDSFAPGFERRIREVASRAVAHIKRGDAVAVSSTLGDRVRADRNNGSDPVLRFLALLDAVDETRAAELIAARATRHAPLAPAPLPTASASSPGGAAPAARPREGGATSAATGPGGSRA
jgi:uncharacterized protein (DUF58 family)